MSPPAKAIVLTGCGCAGKTALSYALRHGHGFATVSVWYLRQMHLVDPAQRDTGDDYEPGCLIAEAAVRIYAARGRPSVLEDIGDREAVAVTAALQRDGIPARLVSIVADEALVRERIAARADVANQAEEVRWILRINDSIRARVLVPGEIRFEARDWAGRPFDMARQVVT